MAAATSGSVRRSQAQRVTVNEGDRHDADALGPASAPSASRSRRRRARSACRSRARPGAAAGLASGTTSPCCCPPTEIAPTSAARPVSASAARSAVHQSRGSALSRAAGARHLVRRAALAPPLPAVGSTMSDLRRLGGAVHAGDQRSDRHRTSGSRLAARGMDAGAGARGLRSYVNRGLRRRQRHEPNPAVPGDGAIHDVDLAGDRVVHGHRCQPRVLAPVTSRPAAPEAYTKRPSPDTPSDARKARAGQWSTRLSDVASKTRSALGVPSVPDRADDPETKQRMPSADADQPGTATDVALVPDRVPGTGDQLGRHGDLVDPAGVDVDADEVVSLLVPQEDRAAARIDDGRERRTAVEPGRHHRDVAGEDPSI